MKKILLYFYIIISVLLLSTSCARQETEQNDTLDQDINTWTSTINDPDTTILDDSSNIIPDETTPPTSTWENNQTWADQNTSTNNSTSATSQTKQIKEFSIIAKNWAFEPSQITVNKWDTVKLKIKSIDVKHGFAIPDFGINSDLNPNEEVTLEFKPDKTGTFSFFCSVMCWSWHRDMKGVLIVK